MGKAARNPATGLTKKQDDFCFQTVVLGNPNRAYRVAYENTNMSDGAVRMEVWKMVRDPKIEERIAEFQAIAEQKLAVSIERIAKELARIAFADFADLFDDAGNAVPLHMLPEDIRRAVHSVDIIEKQAGTLKIGGKNADGEQVGMEFIPERTKKIRLHDKHAALVTLAKWKRMIDQKTEDELDPNDVRSLTDEQLEAEIKASDEALKMIARARGRAKARKPAKAQ